MMNKSTFNINFFIFNKKFIKQNQNKQDLIFILYKIKIVDKNIMKYFLILNSKKIWY